MPNALKQRGIYKADTSKWESQAYPRILLTVRWDHQGCSSLCLPAPVSLLESGAWEFYTLCSVIQGLGGNSELFLALSCGPPFFSVAEGLQGCRLLIGVCLRSLRLKGEPLPFHPRSSCVGWAKNRTVISFLILLLFLQTLATPLQFTKVLFALPIGDGIGMKEITA